MPAEFVQTEDPHDLESQARAAISRGAKLLLAMGGDGTFQSLVNASYGADVVLGVLPAGGGNDFSAALGLTDDPPAAAEAVLNGKPKRVDLVRVRTADGRERLYVGGGGLGLDAEAARHASGRFRHMSGRWRYIASVLRALCSYRPVHLRAEFPVGDMPALEAKVLVASVLNTPTYGAGLRFAPDARNDDGWLDFVVIEDMSALSVLALMPRLLLSGELRTARVRRARVKSVSLIADPSCLFHGDGEILGPTPVEIEVVPQAIQVLAPPTRFPDSKY